jgi:hypothetical protein
MPGHVTRYFIYGIMMVYLGQETKRYLDGKYYTNPFELNIISVRLTHFATFILQKSFGCKKIN